MKRVSVPSEEDKKARLAKKEHARIDKMKKQQAHREQLLRAAEKKAASKKGK